MKNYLFQVLILMALFFMACSDPDPNKQIDEGEVKDNFYTSQEIGWTMRIPNGWKVEAKDVLEARNKKGMKAIEEVAGEFDYSGLKNLINFKKDQYNIFLSTSEPFELEYEGEWEDTNEGLKEVLYKTYQNNGIKCDTASAKTRIDGIDFEVFKIKIYNPKGDDILLNQEMYSALINGFDFAATMNYNNEKDKKILMKVWENSKFKKKK